MTKIFLCAALLATALTPLDARADDGRPSVGISAALATGSSNDDSGRTAIPLLPLPLLDVHVPLGRFEISLEGLPPIGPVTYGSNSTGASRATKLSYGDAALRYRINRFVSVGIGETLYDQETIYSWSRAFNGTIELNGTTYPARFRESYVDPRFSRVAGGRYDVQLHLPASKNSWYDASIALTPSMHAMVYFYDTTQYSIITSAPIRQAPAFRYALKQPESASQLDAQLGAAHRFGPLTLRYGLRYVNYIARFDRGGALADRNSLLLPFVGIEQALGH